MPSEQHEHDLKETRELRQVMAMRAQMLETLAEAMERELVEAITKVLFAGAPPPRVLYSTAIEAYEHRQRMQLHEQFVKDDIAAGRDPAEAMEDLANEADRGLPPTFVEAVDLEVFRGEPPEEVSVKALVAAARYWQGLSRAAFEDDVPNDAPLTEAGRRAAKALARSSFRLARLAVMACVEPHERVDMFLTLASYWRQVNARTP